MTAFVSPPALLIRLELEAAPQILVDCTNEGEEQRLGDWIRSQPAVAQLLDTALDLVAAAEAELADYRMREEGF